MKPVNLIKSIMVLIAMAFAFYGCLNYEQTVKLNRDGSGNIKIHYWTKQTNVMGISKFSFDTSVIKNDQYKPEIVKSVKVDTNKVDSTIHVRLEFDFKDINKLDQLKGFQGSEIKFVSNNDLITLTHKLKQDSAARTFGMDEYVLKYSYEFPSDPINVDPNGKVDGKTVKWEYKYSELGNRDIVMSASFKSSSGNSIIIIIVIILVIGVIVFYVMKSRKKPEEVSIISEENKDDTTPQNENN